MAAGGANTINCWIERDRDQLMRRTLSRPLPQGEIVPSRALVFGIVLNVARVRAARDDGEPARGGAHAVGHALLRVRVHAVAEAPHGAEHRDRRRRRRGARARRLGRGARQPRPRRRGCCSRVVFFWTPAHFWALAVKYRDDYAAAGIPMLPVVRGVEETTRQIAAYAMITVARDVRDDAHRRRRPLLRGGGARARRALRGAGARARARRRRRRPRSSSSRWSNVYLMLVFVAVAVDALVR